MKKVLVVLCMMMMSLQIFSQTMVSKSHYERLMIKSKERKTAAFIFLGGGAAITAGGLLLFDTGLKDSDSKSVFGFFLTGIGIGSMATSIPFFIGAHKARKRALAISMKTERTSLLRKTGVPAQLYPALALHIPLGR